VTESAHTLHTLTFESYETRCAAEFFSPEAGGPFEGPDGHPVIVMAHGFGGTQDCGLTSFAQAFRDAGLAVLTFDYRGFGASDGHPRQQVSVARQMTDYRAAITAAARQSGVDPNRVVLWGVSMSGGHVLTVAADRTDVQAVICMTPLVSGPAAGYLALRQAGAKAVTNAMLTAARSTLLGRFGRTPVMLPIVGRPGERAVLPAGGYYDSYCDLAGPTWRNEVDAAVGLELGRYRTSTYVHRIAAPVLMQIADLDRIAPTHAAAKTATRARAEVRHYPADHFDLFPGRPWFATAVAHQLHFLRRHLGAASSTDTAASGTTV